MVEDTTTARPGTDTQNGASPFKVEGGASTGSASTTGGSDSGTADASAASIGDRARERLTDLGESGKEAVASRIDELADAVHRSGQEFAGKQDWIAQAIEGGAAQLTSLSASLRDRDVPAIVAQVKELAQERPSLFLGASFAVGFALTRFAKIVVADLSRDDLPTLPEVGHG